MKKWLIILVVAGLAYQYRSHWLPQTSQGAFDAQGKPAVMVYVNDRCQGPCDQATAFLASRAMPYEVINVDQQPEALKAMRQLGSPGVLPMIVVGKVRLDGYARAQVDSALAEAYGLQVLPDAGQEIMQNHFEAGGRPKVIMYGVTWCPYCKKARKFFEDNGIEYLELDPEKSSEAKSAYQWLEGNGYPLIYVGARRIEGYREQSLQDTMKEMF